MLDTNSDEMQKSLTSKGKRNARKNGPENNLTKKKSDKDKNLEQGLPKTTCPTCGITITVKGLARHQRETHDQNSEIHPCNMCSFSSKRKDHLMDHQRRMHFEPTGRGRPKKSNQLKSVNEVHLVQLNLKRDSIEFNVNMENKIEDIKTGMDAKIDGMASLCKRSIEFEETKIRLCILEQKQTKPTRPDSKDVESLLRYIGLSSNATSDEIRNASTLES